MVVWQQRSFAFFVRGFVPRIFYSAIILVIEVETLKKKAPGTKWLQFLYILFPIQIVLFILSIVFFLISLFRPSIIANIDSQFAVFALIFDIIRVAIKIAAIKNKTSSKGYKPLIASIVFDLLTALIVSFRQNKYAQSHFAYSALVLLIVVAIAVPNIIYILKRRFIYEDGLTEIALSTMWRSYYDKKYNNNSSQKMRPQSRNTHSNTPSKEYSSHKNTLNDTDDKTIKIINKSSIDDSLQESKTIVEKNLIAEDDNHQNHAAKKNEESSNTGKAPVHAPAIYFCRKCGKKLTPDSAFCNYCGTEIIKEVTDDEV